MMDLGMRPVELACTLARLRARFVVVGGTARMLTSGDGRPRDLDIVVEDTDLPGLVQAVSRLGISTTVASLTRGRQVRLATSWGPLDIFLAPRSVSHEVHVGDVRLAVSP